MGRCTDAYATINDTWDISQENQLLTREGIREFTGMGYHVNDMQTMWTDKLQMMTSHGSRTNQSHKSIIQTNCTKQDDAMSKNGNDEQHFCMLQSNSGAYEGPETG